MMIPLFMGMGEQQPCRCPGGASMGDFVESWWITPGQTREEEDNVNGAVRQLDADIQASTVPLSFVNAWAIFKADWDAFYGDQGGATGWMSRFLTGQPYAKTLDYRKQLESWRARFEQQGGLSTGPGLVPKPVSNSQLPDTFRYIAITAGILGAVYVVSKTGLLSGLVPRTNPRRRRRRR